MVVYVPRATPVMRTMVESYMVIVQLVGIEVLSGILLYGMRVYLYILKEADYIYWSCSEKGMVRARRSRAGPRKSDQQ